MIRGARHQQGGSGGSESLKEWEAEAVPFLSLRNARECLLGAIGIALMCWIGEAFYKVSGTLAAPLWPSSGLALSLLLLRGWRLFPAISLGTITATTAFGDPHLFSIFGSVANTLESLIGWFLMDRIFGFSNSMSRVRDVMILMLAGAPWGTLISAIICTLGLVAVGVVKPDGIPLSSLLFWTGNVLGILIFTPLVLRIDQLRREGALFRASPIEVLWILILTCVVSFGFLIPNTAHTGLITLAYLSFPLLVWLSFSWRRNVIWALALVTTLMTALTATGHGPLLRDNPLATYAEMTIFIMIYGLSCLILMAAVEERALQQQLALEHRLSSQQKEAQLRTLRTSLNPHFLFNSLNTIKSLAAEDSAKAQHAIVGLSDLLRTSLRMTSAERVPLREELSVIRSYLELQKIRHEERLEWSIEEAPSCEEISIPPMLFHQLVENAVKHGVERYQQKTLILVRVTDRGNYMILSVENTGTLPKDYIDGIGLQSIREELLTLYGDGASFSLATTENGTVLAEIILLKERDSIA